MKIIKIVLSVEFVFALFVFAGNFKAALELIPVDLTILLMSYTLIFGLFKFIKEKRKMNMKFVYIWIALLFLISLSMFYTPSDSPALEKYARFAVISTWCFIGPFIIFKDRTGLKRFIYGVISIAIIMGAASLFNANPEEIGFVDVFGSNYQALSRTTASAVLALIAVYLYSGLKSDKRLFSLFTAIFLVIPTLISGGRLAVLTLVIVAIGVFPFLFFKVDLKNKSLQIYKRVYTYLIMSGLTIVAIFIALRLELLNTFMYRLELIFTKAGGGNSVVGRTIRFATAENMISENPFFGAGFGSFGIYFIGLDYTDYPHQIFLEFWSETGIIATFLFALLFMLSLVYSLLLWYKRKNDWVVVSLFAMLLFWWVGTIISSSITDGKILFAFMGVLFTTYYIYKDKYSTEVIKYEIPKGGT